MTKKQERKKQEKAKRRVAWRAVSIGSGALAAAGVRRLAGGAWRRTRRESPPEGVAATGRPLPQALVWAVSLAVGAAIARVVADRLAAAAWTRATGAAPPVPES